MRVLLLSRLANSKDFTATTLSQMDFLAGRFQVTAI